MQAIGAAGVSAAGRSVATGAAPASVQLPGGAAPAAVSAADAASAAALDAVPLGALDSIAIDLVAPTMADMALLGKLSAVAPGKAKVQASFPSVADVRATLNDPDFSMADKLEERRTALLEAGRSGTGDIGSILKELSGLDFIIDLLRRSEEKKRLMKQIMKALMMGALTPSMIRLAKSLGLEGFLKDAIKAQLRSGGLSPQAAKAISGMLAAAGIVIPELDLFVHGIAKKQQRADEAEALAKQQAAAGAKQATGPTKPDAADSSAGTPGTEFRAGPMDARLGATMDVRLGAR